MPRPKSSQNKAKNVETKDKTEELWAQYGKLQASREGQEINLQNTIQNMRNIFLQIQKIERKE